MLDQLETAAATISSQRVSPPEILEFFRQYVGVFALFGTIIAAGYAYRVNVRNKRFDVIISCNGRYDTLYQDRLSIDDHTPAHDIKVRQYFRRYWGLKSDQFEYWLAGGVDPQTFSNWFMSTLRSFQNDSHVGRLGYRSSWHAEKYDIDIINKSFVDFVSTIHAIAINQKVDADQKYFAMLHAMHEIEKRERQFNRYLFDGVPEIVRGRLTVQSLMKTLPSETKQSYRRYIGRRPKALVEG